MKILFENWRRYLEEQAEKIEIEEPEDDDGGEYVDDDPIDPAETTETEYEDEDELDEGCGEDVAGISPRRDVATIAILDES
jgi:hypothetical protein